MFLSQIINLKFWQEINCVTTSVDLDVLVTIVQTLASRAFSSSLFTSLHSLALDFRRIIIFIFFLEKV